MIRGFKYRLYPTDAQAQTMREWMGVARFVYNISLEQRRDYWRQFSANTGRSISRFTQSKELTQALAENDWLRAPPRIVLEQAIKDLDFAYAKFFRGGGYPKFRHRHINKSFRVSGGCQGVCAKINAKWASIKIPKLGRVKFRLTRPMPCEVINFTVSEVNGRWFVAIIAKGEAASPASGEVGIDRGVAHTLSLSNGETFSLPNMVEIERRMRRSQRILARRKIGSNRRARQRLRVAAIKAKVGRIRCDALHRVSTDIARRFAVVGIEDLKIKNMTASASGTIEAPGRNVAQKRGLNRSILHQGWGMFAEMLAYKLGARNGLLVKVNPAYTSQTCSECGVIDAKSRKSQAVFHCVACDHTANADVNAAKEILRRSTAWLRGEGHTIDPSNREPAMAD